MTEGKKPGGLLGCLSGPLYVENPFEKYLYISVVMGRRAKAAQ